MVDVVPLEARHLPALEQLVAAHLRLARFPFDASPLVLRQRVARVLGSDGLLAERRRWMVWAALDHQHLVGAARAYAVDRQSGQAAHQDDQVPADIGWLLFEPDRPAAGAALLESALDWIGEDPEGIQAFELAHGLGWGGGIPTAWPHVEEAITRGGFVCQATSYLMWGADTAGFSGAVHHDAQIALEVTPSGAWRSGLTWTGTASVNCWSSRWTVPWAGSRPGAAGGGSTGSTWRKPIGSGGSPPHCSAPLPSRRARAACGAWRLRRAMRRRSG